MVGQPETGFREINGDFREADFETASRLAGRKTPMRSSCPASDNFRFARDSGRIGCLLRMHASFRTNSCKQSCHKSRPALTQNLYAKKHSVRVHAVFHSSLRPRDG